MSLIYQTEKLSCLWMIFSQIFSWNLKLKCSSEVCLGATPAFNSYQWSLPIIIRKWLLSLCWWYFYFLSRQRLSNFQHPADCSLTKIWFLYHTEIITLNNIILQNFYLYFFQLGVTPWKAEQPLRGMEPQEKEARSLKHKD